MQVTTYSGVGKVRRDGKRDCMELEVFTGAEVLLVLRVFSLGKQVTVCQLAFSSTFFFNQSMTKFAVTGSVEYIM